LTRRKTVLFLLPYPLEKAPSQRFRVEAYFPLLNQKGIVYDTDSFLNANAWQILYKDGSVLQKGWAVLKGFLKRAYTVFFCSFAYSYIFIHREAAPLGPPFFEWCLAKILRKKIIYDFDDAIWIPNVTASNKIARFLKCFWKVRYICKWSYKVSAGNHFLAEFAGRYHTQVALNPTCVDTRTRYIVESTQIQQKERLVIGWTGSHSTLQFFEVGVPALKRLEKLFHFRLLVICDKKPEYDLPFLEFIPWNKASEIEDLAKIDIGIMPLKDDAWSEGKCGFKLIQYMALGIAAVASPVGVNKTIIEHGVEGYLCNTDDEWIRCLSELLQDAEKRKAFGQKGRKKIEKLYSLDANASNFLSLFS
jgi:glycosyltransferase involved in cell wall biosynthesis